jgi:hypothetical protein
MRAAALRRGVTRLEPDTHPDWFAASVVKSAETYGLPGNIPKR